MLLVIGKIIFGIYYRVFFRLRVEGKENIPREGAAIICANHISYNDPIVLCLISKRKLHLVAKQELFKNKFFGFVLRRLHAIPVNREKTDMSTYKAVMKILQGNGMVGIFAQGTRVKEGEAQDIKAGVALFALKGNACVVPTYIDATYRLFSKITVRFGAPMTLEAYRGVKLKSEGLAEVADYIMNQVNDLAAKEV